MADKATALVHMLALEVGPDLLDKYTDSVVALVTDQGTEHLIATVGPLSIDTVAKDDAEALNGSKLHTVTDNEPKFLMDDDSFLVGQSNPSSLDDRNHDTECIDLVSSESETETTGAGATVKEVQLQPSAGSSQPKTLPRLLLNSCQACRC